MHTVVYHLYDDWQPTLGVDQVRPNVAAHMRACLTAWSVLSCDVANPSLTALVRHSTYIKEIGWERTVALLKDLKAQFQILDVPTGDFIGLHAPYAEIIRPIRESVIKAIRGDARFFIKVNTWLAFVTKLHVPNPKLAQEALTKWESAETNMGVPTDELVDYLSYLFRKVRPFRAEEFYPRHGSGQTADGYLDRIAGNRLRSKDMVLSDTGPSQLIYWGGLSEWSTEGAGPLEHTNVLTFVPKSATALRAISMEPTLLQFLQQGLKDILYRDFERNDIFRDSIHLRDSGFNRRLALEGSRTGHWATIDLSSASDTVSNYLIRAASVGTSWFRPLMSTRSSHTLLPNGERVQLRKFAPMGSAVAFPVECMVFLAAARCASQDDTSGQYERQHALVYGDDIIVHSAVAPRLTEILSESGFTVNLDKSFLTGPFRESCGVEAYRGVDITPMYHRVSYLDGLRRLYPGLVAHANEAFEKGLWRLREYYIAQIRLTTQRRYQYVPFTTDYTDTSRIWSRTGTTRAKEWDLDLQLPLRPELVEVCRTKTVQSAEADAVRLQIQLHDLERAKAPWTHGPLLEQGHVHEVSTTSAIAVRRVRVYADDSVVDAGGVEPS
jgi:hypothetical protein